MTEIPEGIPQDVWSAALDIDIDADFGWDGQTTTGLQAERECRLSIARAILAERERCAAIKPEPDIDKPTNNYGDGYVEGFWDAVARFAAAIRTPA